MYPFSAESLERADSNDDLDVVNAFAFLEWQNVNTFARRVRVCHLRDAFL